MLAQPRASSSPEAQRARARATGAAPIRQLTQLEASSSFHWEYWKTTPSRRESHDSRIAACYTSKLPCWQMVCSSVVAPLQPGVPGPARYYSFIRNSWEGRTETSKVPGSTEVRLKLLKKVDLSHRSQELSFGCYGKAIVGASSTGALLLHLPVAARTACQ